MAFLRNLSLTHEDVVSGTFPVAAVCSELLSSLVHLWPSLVWLEVPHPDKGKLLVICVTCVMGRMWPGGCWCSTTKSVVGNHLIQTTYHFI